MKAQTFYREMGVNELPWITEATLQAGRFLWILAFAANFLILLKARRGQRDRSAFLFRRLAMSIVFVQILMLWSLYYPIYRIMMILRDR
jgi:hypothetical protein